MDDGHSPHLRVNESSAKEVAILSSSDGDLMGSARASLESAWTGYLVGIEHILIVCSVNKSIPSLS